MSKNNGYYNPQSYIADWKEFWANSKTMPFRDEEILQMIAKVQAGAQLQDVRSIAKDFAVIGRCAALFSATFDYEKLIVEACQSVIGLTHRAPEVVEAAEFFVRVVLDTKIRESDISTALANVEKLDHWKSLDVKRAMAAARETAYSDKTDLESLAVHGTGSSVEEAFPATLHILLRYPDDCVSGLAENVLAGGETVARGAILGMVYWVHWREFPISWVEDNKIIRKFRQIPGHGHVEL